MLRISFINLRRRHHTFQFSPSGLLGPLGPFSVAVAWNKRNKQKLSGLHDPISQEKAADATLGKNPDDGLYLAYCSLSGLFVSGSRCLPYREKLRDGVIPRPSPRMTAQKSSNGKV